MGRFQWGARTIAAVLLACLSAAPSGWFIERPALLPVRAGPGAAALAMTGPAIPPTIPGASAAEAGQASERRPARVEVVVPLDGVDRRLAAIVAVIFGVPLAGGELTGDKAPNGDGDPASDGATATFLVPAAAEDTYRRLFHVVFGEDGAVRGADGARCRSLTPGGELSDPLIVRFHPGVSPQLVEVLAVVFGTRVLDRIEGLQAYLLVRPPGLCAEEFQALLLLSPLVSSVERNAPVYAF